MQELAEQISKTQLEILAIQEIKWSGTGLIKKQNYSLYYSGHSSKTGQAGTGFIFLKKMQNYVIGFEPYNERLCKLQLKGKYNNNTLINVYAPTEDHTEEIKEQFYDDLQYLLDETSKNDIIIILGDVNAQLGKERLYNEVIGQHTLHEETNINGELLCEFACANNMVVMSTNFQHKRIHKITWLSPDQNTASLIDHIIINANKKGVIEDVKTMRGPNIDSDHFLVKAVIKQKLSVMHKKKLKPALKWNKVNLQNPSKLMEYRSLLHTKLINLVPKQEINDEWEQIKTTIVDAARGVIQIQGTPPRNEWWDEECKKIIQEKNEARKNGYN